MPAHPDDAYIYPYWLGLPGRLHILYNALKEGIEAMDGHKDFLDKLRSICAFLNNKAFRRAFAARCLDREDQRRLFAHFSQVHVDWKWEFLTRLLKPLVPMLPLLAEKFDANKLCDSSCTVTEKGTINQIAAILKHDPDIAAVSELVRVVGSTIDKVRRFIGDVLVP